MLQVLDDLSSHCCWSLPASKEWGLTSAAHERQYSLWGWALPSPGDGQRPVRKHYKATPAWFRLGKKGAEVMYFVCSPQHHKCTAACECPIPMRRTWTRVQSRVPLAFSLLSQITPQLSLPCEEHFGYNRRKGGKKHFIQQILCKSQAMSQKQLFYTSCLLSANAIEMNEWRSKYLMKHTKAFFSFPSPSHSALLIDSKVKIFSVWSSIREAWWFLYFPQGILISILSLLLLFSIYWIFDQWKG